jgi:L-ascorbate metabolism protein UlaG (beta-lactamase superfamily)
MSVKIKWFGHASFRISGSRSVVYIDPWKLDESPRDGDVVIISHSHHDHCSPVDVEKVASPDATLVAPPDTIAKLGARNAITPGEGWTLRDVTIEAVAAYNVGKEFHPAVNEWIGAVVTIGRARVYYAGDTDLIPEMSGLSDIDVALLPVGGTYTLDPAEAADACGRIAPAMAIPYHWGDVVGSDADAKAFADQAPCSVTVLAPGESFELPEG